MKLCIDQHKQKLNSTQILSCILQNNGFVFTDVVMRAITAFFGEELNEFIQVSLSLLENAPTEHEELVDYIESSNQFELELLEQLAEQIFREEILPKIGIIQHINEIILDLSSHINLYNNELRKLSDYLYNSGSVLYDSFNNRMLAIKSKKYDSIIAIIYEFLYNDDFTREAFTNFRSILEKYEEIFYEERYAIYLDIIELESKKDDTKNPDYIDHQEAITDHEDDISKLSEDDAQLEEAESKDQAELDRQEFIREEDNISIILWEDSSSEYSEIISEESDDSNTQTDKEGAFVLHSEAIGNALRTRSASVNIPTLAHNITDTHEEYHLEHIEQYIPFSGANPYIDDAHRS